MTRYICFALLLGLISGILIKEFIEFISYQLSLDMQKTYSASKLKRSKGIKSLKITTDSRYPYIQTISALILVLSLFARPYSISSNNIVILFASWIFTSILLTISIFDIKYMLIPRFIQIFGVMAGLITTILSERILNLEADESLFSYHLMAIFVGFISSILIEKIGRIFLKRDCLGRGDAIFMAVVGSWLGLRGMGLAAYFGIIMSGIYAVIRFFLKKKDFKKPYPFTPFIATGALLIWMSGKDYWINNFL